MASNYYGTDRTYRKREILTIGLFIFFTLFRLFFNYFSDKYIIEYTDMIQRTIERRLATECRAIKNMVTVEELNEFVEVKDEQKPLYKEITQELAIYAEENGLTYVYFMRLVDGKVQYILDSDQDPESYCGLDYFEDPEPIAMRAFNGEVTFNTIGEYAKGWEGLLSAYIPIYNDEGEVVAVAGVDIRDERIVQREKVSRILDMSSMISTLLLVVITIVVIRMFRKKVRDYHSASIAKGQFLSRMSHEIRTPMNAIIGFCEIAKRTEEVEKKQECLDNIGNSSEYLLQLINRILDISRIEAGKSMTLNREEISAYGLIRHIEHILKPQVKIKEQEFIINIGKGIPRRLYGDKTRLTQILLNILSNALKFTPRGGRASIEVCLLEKREDCSNIQFIVKDSGIGMDEEYISRIFEPFEQKEGGTTRQYGGAGLGLAITKLFIEMMRGEISVTSKMNEGTAFKFNVWLDNDKGEETSDEENEEPKGDYTLDCGGKTFLLVEDNEINQEIAQTILKEFGAIIEIAKNGEEGVAKFLEDPDKYDMIFMDIQMPVMDGYQATTKIRESNLKRSSSIPIIAMTAEVYEEDIKRTEEVGMNAHLGKPFQINELITIIKNNLKN